MCTEEIPSELDKRLEKVNCKIKDYCEYLANENPIFLDNIIYFASFSDIFKTTYDRIFLSDDRKTYKNFENTVTKESMTNSFNLVKQYFHDAYNGIYDDEIKQIKKNGIINLHYRDEDDEKEDRYNRNYCDNKFSCVDGDQPNINLPCYGTIIDGQIIAHEIRHYLNMPNEIIRGYVNDTITEALSIFEELNYLDYIEKIYPMEEVILLRKYLLYIHYINCGNFDFTSLLVSMYDKLGKISTKNYKLYMGKESVKKFETDLLNKNIQLNIDVIYWYIFGIIIAIYMHQKIKMDSTFILKINNFNTTLKSNPKADEFLSAFHSIDLDINNLQLQEEYLIKELEYIKSLSGETQITK